MFDGSRVAQLGRQPGLDLRERGVRILPRHESPIDFNGATVGHGVDADAAANHADAHRRPAHQAMLGQRRDHVARVLLQGRHHAGHPVDGVVAQVRLRTVRGSAERVTAPAERTFVRHHDIQLGRLGDDRGIGSARQQRIGSGLPALRQLRRATAAELLIHRTGNDDRRQPRRTFFDQT